MILLLSSWQSSSALVGSGVIGSSAVLMGPAVKLPLKSSTHTRLFPSPTQTWLPLAAWPGVGHAAVPAKPGAGAVNGVSKLLSLVLTTWTALLVRSARR